MQADKLIANFKNYFESTRCDKVVVGLSGGVDSTTVVYLAVKALGKGKVVGISMPEDGLSSLETLNYPKLICEKLGIGLYTVSINPYLIKYKLPWGENASSKMNTKARIRATILYHYANTYNALVLGTGNKTELRLGYFTKYGDGAVDIEVLGNLWKTQVFELARVLGVPKEIISRVPTAELYPGHTDEKELGANYSDIDKILQEFESGKNQQEIVAMGFDNKIVERILLRIKQNKHKSSLISLPIG